MTDQSASAVTVDLDELANVIKQALPMTMRNESPCEARVALAALLQELRAHREREASGGLESLNDFHRQNVSRQHEAFAPPHSLTALVVCVQEEVGELAGAVLGVTGEKKRKAHLTRSDVLDAVADAMTYLSLVAANVGCEDLEKLLGDTFNFVSDRAGSKVKTKLGQRAAPLPAPPEGSAATEGE